MNEKEIIGIIKSTVSVGVTESIGHRSSMEDTHLTVTKLNTSKNDGVEKSFFAVFDGHGGSDGSNLARETVEEIVIENLNLDKQPEEALRDTFHQIDKGIEDSGFPYGCTAASVLLEGNSLTVANVGDTRVLLIKLGEGEETAQRISKDHTLSDEEEVERVKATGAQIARVRIMVGNVGINVVRALGDKFFGEAVSADPTVSKQILAPGKYRVVLECDGVWQAVPDEDLAKLITGKNPKDATEALVKKANDDWVNDNFTAIVVDIEIF